MGYMIKGMMPIIETTNSMLKATLKKESFEPAKNLRTTSDVFDLLLKVITEQFFSNTIFCMCNVIETFLHDWFEIIFTVLIKEGAHCRKHSQTI
jgi:hypothetical protein